MLFWQYKTKMDSQKQQSLTGSHVAGMSLGQNLSRSWQREGTQQQQECGQPIPFFLSEAKGIDYKLILKCNLTVVPAGSKYPSQKLIKLSCCICIPHCKNWAAVDPMSLPATTMKANLFCPTVNASDTEWDQLSIFEVWLCP